MADRDRDETGKARNRRPRDALGRPLPHGSVGMPRIPEDLKLTASESISYAQQLLDQDLAFHAHEVLEAAWKRAPEEERALWQGLAQLAVGVTHIQRGNMLGARNVLGRAAERLSVTDNPAPYGVNTAGLIDHLRLLIRDLQTGIESAGERRRPRLRRSEDG